MSSTSSTAEPTPLFDIYEFSEELATKLLDQQVLFYTGAGLSCNWGIPLGFEVAELLRSRFLRLVPDVDPRTLSLLRGINCGDLPMISELVGQNKCWYIRELIVPDVTHPPALSPLGLPLKEMLRSDPVQGGRIGVPHIVIARLAKEGLIKELLTTNVDCLHETACEAVGMVSIKGDGGKTAIDFPWPETYQVVADRSDHAKLGPERNLFTIHKIHGCLEKVRAQVRDHIEKHPKHACTWNQETPHGACKELAQDKLNFVFTYRELLNWRRDHWARDLLADRVRNHHIVFSGFALADSVSHATFRDVFEEVVEPTSVKLGSGNTKNRDTRAQMISDKLNLQTAAVLLAANRRDPFHDEKHVAEVGRTESRKNLEDLFRAIYARAMVNMLKRQIWLRGPGILKGWFGKSMPQRVTECRELQVYLAGLSNTPHFMYDVLPSAVRLSWLATDRLVESGLPERESRSPYLARFMSAHYYVPLGHELETTMILLQTYRLLLAGTLPGESALVLPNGWVRYSAADRPARAILPLLAPREGNLPILARLRGLQPPLRTEAGLLLITPTLTTATPVPLGFANTALGASGSLEIRPVSYRELWGPSAIDDMKARLDEAKPQPRSRMIS